MLCSFYPVPFPGIGSRKSRRYNARQLVTSNEIFVTRGEVGPLCGVERMATEAALSAVRSLRVIPRHKKRRRALHFAISGLAPPARYSALTMSSTIFLASANSIMVLSA